MKALLRIGLSFLFFAQLGLIGVAQPGGIITTIAGNGAAGYGGDGGQATAASLQPESVAMDRTGNLFIADTRNQRIREVTPDGVIGTVAGNGTWGFSGDKAPAIFAQFNYPYDVAVDSMGNLFIADYLNNRIRKVSPYGIITTIAGTGTPGYGGDGGPATSAYLHAPYGVAVDTAGNLFIADSNNERIRKVTPEGVISTVAGTGARGFGGDGGPATSAQFYTPRGIAVDTTGNLFIADINNNRIRKVTPGGVISTVAGNGVRGFGGDGGPATSALLNFPLGVAVDTAGYLFIADSDNNRIRRVTPGGIIATIAGNGVRGFGGDGDQATAAYLNAPIGLAVDAEGNLYIADAGNRCVRKVTGVSFSEILFPQVAVGGGYTTIFTVTNTGPTTASGNLILMDPQGKPLSVNGTLTYSSGTTLQVDGDSFALTVPSGGTIFLSITGLAIQTGWATLESTGGFLTGVATYEYVVDSTIQSMVGILHAQPMQYATIPVDIDGSQDKQLAYAIANPGSQTIVIKVALVGQDGTLIEDSETVTLGPGEQMAQYLRQELVRTSFKGSLVLRGQAGATFVALGLLDKQGIFTVIPVISGKAPGVPD